MRTQQAVAQSGASTNARRQIEREGLALGGEAVNLYRGLPSSSAQALGAGTTAGATGLQGTGAAGQQGQAAYGMGAGMLGQQAGMAASGWGTANSIYGNQLQGWQTEVANSPAAVLSGLAGAAIPFMFDGGGSVSPEMSPSRGAIPDDVPALVSAGEHILEDDVVRYHGLKTISKMEKEAKEAMGIPMQEPQR